MLQTPELPQEKQVECAKTITSSTCRLSDFITNILDMEHNDKNEMFCYTYSAKHQDEIKSIRQKYIPREESKMEQLHRLDKSATTPERLPLLLSAFGAPNQTA